MIEKTLSIIKPDGVKRNLIGKIAGRFEENHLKIVAMHMKWLSTREAEGFYAVHKSRPFFRELVTYMCSGPVVVMVLEGESAVTRNREIMGATNPANANPGTIRKDFGLSVGENTVHGSDSLENARIEVEYFFPTTSVMSSTGI